MQKFDAPAERPETGVVQFGNDWPGIFVRGDEALSLAQMLDRIADEFDDGQFYKSLHGKSCKSFLRGIAEQFRECRVNEKVA